MTTGVRSDTGNRDHYRPASLGDEDTTVNGDHTKVVPDPFEAAARLFAFTPAPSGETKPDKPAHHTVPVPSARVQEGQTVAAPRRLFTGMRAVSLSARVMGVVGLMTIGMTVDAEALPHEHDTPATTSTPSGAVEEIQAYVSPAQTGTAINLSRDSYSTATLVDFASTASITNYSDAVFTNNPSCAVQWPYAAGVPITYGYGMRSGKMHEGTDFVPGAGAHIQAIADGVVSVATDSGGAFGVTIVIDHVVNGQRVSSRYAHMEYDSRQVEVGEEVDVGQYIGRTGNTGRSFGAHLHFEVLRNGTTATDPLPWLRTNATC